jgi:hypothetical protein
MGALMALAAAVRQIDAHRQRRQRLRGFRVGHVAQTRAVAGLALDVVIAIVGYGVPAGRDLDDVAELADGVASLAERLGVAAVLETRPRFGVVALFPLRLRADVAVAADGQFRFLVRVTEKTARFSCRLLEKSSVFVNDPLDDRLIGTGGDDEGHDGQRHQSFPADARFHETRSGEFQSESLPCERSINCG